MNTHQLRKDKSFEGGGEFEIHTENLFKDNSNSTLD